MRLYFMNPRCQKQTYNKQGNRQTGAENREPKYMEHRLTEFLINTGDKHYTNDTKGEKKL